MPNRWRARTPLAGSGVSLNEHEFLKSFPGFDFTRIDISGRIRGHRVYRVELTRISAVVAKRTEHFAVTSTKGPYHVVRGIGHNQVLLARITREGNHTNGPRTL